MNRKKIFNLTGGKCFYCGCNLNFENFHVDHFKSKASGGKEKDNLVPACQDCNLFKSNLGVEDFRRKIENLGSKNIQTRMMCKYWNVEKPNIKFWYENN